MTQMKEQFELIHSIGDIDDLLNKIVDTAQTKEQKGELLTWFESLCIKLDNSRDSQHGYMDRINELDSKSQDLVQAELVSRGISVKVFNVARKWDQAAKELQNELERYNSINILGRALELVEKEEKNENNTGLKKM